MNRHSPLFRIAFTAMSLAIALPLLVFCAAHVRHRQLQSKGTRWESLAKTGSASPKIPSSAVITQPQTASPQGEISLNESPRIAALAVSHVRDLTGSVTGSSPIEMPVAKSPPSDVRNAVVASERSPFDSSQSTPSQSRHPIERVAIEPPTRIASMSQSDREHFPTQGENAPVEDGQRQLHVSFKPTNDARMSRTSAAEEVESRLAGMQRRLDQLAQAQVDGKLSELDRAAKLVDQLERSRAKSLISQLDSATDQNLTERSNAEALVPPVNVAASPTNAAASSSSSGAREGTIKIIQGEKGVAGDGNLEDEKFSLQVHDAELTQVLDMLAQLAGVNILPSPEVQGRITLNLQDVTVDRALEAILKSRGFVHQREADFVYVRSVAEVARLTQLNRKLVTKVYQPMYISASELSKLLAPILTKDVGQHAVTSPAQVGIATTPGNAGGDSLAQRDALLVQDYFEVIEVIDKIIIEMDVPPLQVLIEAKILSVALSDTMEFGVNFALLNGHHGSASVADAPSVTGASGDFSANANGLKCGCVAGDIKGFLRSLERIADTSLVAAPVIRVLNKQKAEMIIGDRVSYKTLAFNGTQTVENVQFLDAGTKLLFRPFISPDGLVRLEIHPERSSATINKDTGLPNLTTTEVTTNIMVRDGSTVVIGGLISEETRESNDRVPLLGAIPLVGAAFRNKTERTQRHELIVLITPHIVTEPESSIEGAALQAETEDRAAHIRDNLSPVNRHNLARRHYERAQDYIAQGNLLKARQQIDAALRQNKADREALRLQAQIEQATCEQQARYWKWPSTTRVPLRK